jgi:sulfate adenylyltransferase subunit 1 (EFTu-like GTPase family)
MLADAAAPPTTARELRAALCWLDSAPQDPRAPYLIRIGTRIVAARVGAPESRIDVDTLDRVGDGAPLKANEIGEARIRLQDDIAYDAYGDCRATGAFIVIDSRTNATVAAGMIDHGI